MSNITQAERLYRQPNDFSQATAQRYNYSFSGADAKTMCFFPQRPDLISPLDTVHTISVSVHEGKSQVRSLGYRGMKGMARGVRTIAGSIILTVVNDHPLRALIDQYNTLLFDSNFAGNPLGWSVDRDETGVGTYANQFAFENRLASLLPPFNILIEFVAEGTPVTKDTTTGTPVRIGPDGNSSGVENQRLLFPGAGLMLQGIEIIDEGFIVSVNDIVTEITCSFVARDFKPISASTFSNGEGAPITISDMAAREQELRNRCFGNSYTYGADPNIDDGQVIRTQLTSASDSF